MCPGCDAERTSTLQRETLQSYAVLRHGVAPLSRAICLRNDVNPHLQVRTSRVAQPRVGYSVNAMTSLPYNYNRATYVALHVIDNVYAAPLGTLGAALACGSHVANKPHFKEAWIPPMQHLRWYAQDRSSEESRAGAATHVFEVDEATITILNRNSAGENLEHATRYTNGVWALAS